MGKSSVAMMASVVCLRIDGQLGLGHTTNCLAPTLVPNASAFATAAGTFSRGCCAYSTAMFCGVGGGDVSLVRCDVGAGNDTGAGSGTGAGNGAGAGAKTTPPNSTFNAKDSLIAALKRQVASATARVVAANAQTAAADAQVAAAKDVAETYATLLAAKDAQIAELHGEVVALKASNKRQSVDRGGDGNKRRMLDNHVAGGASVAVVKEEVPGPESSSRCEQA